ncbi:MAG: hypothetical protein IR526_00400 [Bordetella sp.]|nr:MAG: hypothetical protein IR526_00400 [Bordetella sp.]
MAISIISNISVSVILKAVYKNDNIDSRPIIFLNYLFASIFCWVFLYPDFGFPVNFRMPWLILLALGVLFPIVFLSMGQSLKYTGIIRSDLAQRLSIFVSLSAAFIIFDTKISILGIFSIFFSIISLWCLLYQFNIDKLQRTRYRFSIWIWPFLVFLGYGIIDILFKLLSQFSIEILFQSLLISFVLSGIITFIYTIICQVYWKWIHLLIGFSIGLLNFTNIITYILSHQCLPDHPIFIFITMNISVVVIGILIGILIFDEPIIRLNIIGLLLGIIAILTMVLNIKEL